MIIVHDKDIEIHLSLCPQRLINMQNDETFCKAIINLINENKLSSSKRYFVNDRKLLHKAVREDDKSFHALVVP